MKKIDDYLKQADWRVKENSNSNYSFMALQAYISANEMVEWAFENMYKGEIAEAHKQGFIHIHDLSHPIVGYCAGWSLEDLIKEGFNADDLNVYSRPAKHLLTLYKQINNFLFTLANEWAGAQAFNSLDTFSAGYIKHENLSDDEIHRAIEGLIYDLNVKTRHGSQTPFTNFSMDLTVPDDLKGRPVMIGDTEADFTYGDCQEEMNRFNKILTDIMIEGDGMGKPFTFPIITYSITPNFPWGSDLSKAIFTFADECNSPYFSNFINSNSSPSDVRSMCCRLRLDLTQLINAGGGLFGSGDKTGSLGVVTLNLPRIAYVARNKCYAALKNFNIELTDDYFHNYFQMLTYFSELARESLLIKRKYVNKSLDSGLLTYTKRYLGNFDKHFNTIGVNGGNEACKNLLNAGIDDDTAKEIMIETLDFLRNKCEQWQVRDKTLLWNLEATPAEGASTRFAKLDKAQFQDIITGNGHDTFYTNSTQLPDDYTDNVFEVFKHQNDLQPLYTSGTVQHIYLNEPTHNWQVIENLVKKLFTNFKLPYLSISPDITVCPICGRLDKSYDYCPNEHTPEQIKAALEKGLISVNDIIGE